MTNLEDNVLFAEMFTIDIPLDLANPNAHELSMELWDKLEAW